MKIMVFDVPAEHGGALTILKQYYERAINDIENEWFFIVSTPNLKETKNVKVIKYPWVKRSWFHRLYFDQFIAKKIVTENKIDEVLSLQNVIIKNIDVKQTLYLHQPLPFVEKRYSITENFKFWVYQNIISKMIFRSIQEADKVIVQTNWMKQACLKKVNVNPSKFEIKQPEISIIVRDSYKQSDDNKKIFFYPSSGLIYKNHIIIIEAVKKLLEQNISNFRVIFTLTGNENNHIKKLHQMVQEFSLPIDFIGQIKLNEVYNYYSKSTLIFPSFIETFGLPLLEAKMHNCPILASNCAFSQEILQEYRDASFFDPFDKNNLFELMKEAIKGD